ncbi:hypothetical protein [Amycolatopsis pithecellobii]|uniref:Uncharacterized protein n=1 Tax=Amycolatopsis pithecellobii TaxID=664692 RepID=A0A6N7ZC81_9PSEU|nr:hypothetical protein [Amycolatopsis pithecellobii]MTD59394.1 hypothetical protein [Amycolatopsis pithecellobii]
MHEQREALGLSTVIVQGEPGGASVPYISGGYGWDRDRRLARSRGRTTRPSKSCVDCRRFVISVNELDPLRDEGIAFARRLRS